MGLRPSPRRRASPTNDRTHRDLHQPDPRRHHPRGPAHPVRPRRRGRARGDRAAFIDGATRPHDVLRRARRRRPPPGRRAAGRRARPRARCWRSWRRTAPSTAWCSTPSRWPAGSSPRSTRPTPTARCTTSSSTPARPGWSPSRCSSRSATEAMQDTAVKELFVIGEADGATAAVDALRRRRSPSRCPSTSTTSSCCPTRRAPPACPRA